MTPTVVQPIPAKLRDQRKTARLSPILRKDVGPRRRLHYSLAFWQELDGRRLARTCDIGVNLAKIREPYGTFAASNTPTDGLAKPLARSCCRVNWERKGPYCPRYASAVILNSKEEIGWKVQPQNRNLWQEIL